MVTTADKLSRFCDYIGDLFLQDRSLNPSELIAENFRLSRETEADPGRYLLSENPYWEKPINQLMNPRVFQITIKKSTQVGGTLTSQGLIYAIAVLDPSPGMFVFPTKDEAATQRDRLYGNGLVSETTFSCLVPSRHNWNLRTIQLLATRINIAWPGSDQRLRGKPCKWVFLNEPDVYEWNKEAGNPHKAAAERVKQFPEHGIWRESTPVGEDSHICQEYEKSNQEDWWCWCPHCNAPQILRFFPPAETDEIQHGYVDGYKDENGNLLEPEEAEAKAFYRCAKGCKIWQNEKNLMIKGGMWLPKGQYIDEGGEIQGKAIRSERHSGFYIWTIMQSKISIGRIASKYIECLHDGDTRNFIQDWLGQRYTEKKKIPKFEDVAKRYSSLSLFNRGEVPPQVWFTTLGADVQEHEVYWSLVGWSPLRTCYLIDWGIEELVEDEELIRVNEGLYITHDLYAFSQNLDKQYPILGKNPIGMEAIKALSGGADTNYRNLEVHELTTHTTELYEYERLLNVRGDKATNFEKNGPRFKESIVEKNARTGEEYPGGLHLYSFNKNFYRSLWRRRMVQDPAAPSSWQLPKDILPGGKKLLRQCLNEKLSQKTEESPKKWTPIDYGLRLDFRDSLMIAEVVAEKIVSEVFIQEGRKKVPIMWHPRRWDLWKEQKFAPRVKQKAHAKKEKQKPASDRKPGKRNSRQRRDYF